eukprot:6172753-Pleurochrysis_carterae.AAC.2
MTSCEQVLTSGAALAAQNRSVPEICRDGETGRPCVPTAARTAAPTRLAAGTARLSCTKIRLAVPKAPRNRAAANLKR